MSGQPRPERIVATLREHRPSVFFCVPALYGALVRAPEADGALDSVRLCVSAAEALPPATFDRWKERFGLEIVDGIGSTEMLHIFWSNRPGDVVRGSTRRPVSGYELRIVDPVDGSVLSGEAVGNLEARGDSCGVLLAPAREDEVVHARRLVHHRRPLPPRRRRRLLVRGAGRRHAQGRRAVGLAGRHGEDADGAPAVLGVGVVGVTVEDQSRVAAYVIREPGEQSDD
jgi:non-ribosomal peptide synthetase component F